MKIAELFVRLSADTAGLKRGMAEADTAMSRFGKTAVRVGGLVGAGLFAGIVKNTIEAQNAVAQLNAVVKSTGGAAGFATPQLQAMATGLQKVSTFSDEAIMGAQGLLLTFTRIKGAEFEGATQAVMNLAQAMGGDLKGAAIQVGKALNDPVRGLTALRKAGIQFSESQTATIKKLVETGQIAEAQRVILKELEVQFGGSAAAARNTLGGALIALKNAFGDTLEASGEATAGITGALNQLADWMPKIREKFGAFFGGVEMMLVDLAITWQENFLKMRGVAASFLEAVGGSFSKSFVPKIREWGKGMLDTAADMRAGVDMTRSALEAWRTEQYNLIAGLNATVAPVKTVTAGVDGLTNSTNAAADAARKLATEWKAAKNEMEAGSPRVSDVGAKGSAESFKGEKAAKGAGGFADIASAEAAAKAGKTGGGGPWWKGANSQDSMGTRVGQVLQSGGGGGEMDQMVQAFASFGPMAALLPVINGAMEKLGPAFSKLIAPLVDLGASIGEMLVPVFEMLAPIVQLVVASMKVFQPVLKMVVKGFSYLMQGLGYAVKAVGKLIDSLPFVSAPGIIRAGQEMIDAAKAARDNADATDEATEALEKFAGALSNIPRVLNINALRHLITGGGTGGGGGGPYAPPTRPGGGGPGGLGGGVVIQQMTVIANNPEEFMDRMGRVAERTATRGGTPRLALALR